MADGQLREPQIVRLGAKIQVDTIEDIARTKFKLDDAAIANIISENQGNVKKQSQEMIRAWKYRQGTCVNQVEVRNGLFNTLNVCVCVCACVCVFVCACVQWHSQINIFREKSQYRKHLKTIYSVDEEEVQILSDIDPSLRSLLTGQLTKSPASRLLGFISYNSCWKNVHWL